MSLNFCWINTQKQFGILNTWNMFPGNICEAEIFITKVTKVIIQRKLRENSRYTITFVIEISDREVIF